MEVKLDRVHNISVNGRQTDLACTKIQLMESKWTFACSFSLYNAQNAYLCSLKLANIIHILPVLMPLIEILSIVPIITRKPFPRKYVLVK